MAGSLSQIAFSALENELCQYLGSTNLAQSYPDAGRVHQSARSRTVVREGPVGDGALIRGLVTEAPGSPPRSKAHPRIADAH